MGVMSVNVKLSDSFVEQAKQYAAIQHRSVPKQIEYWSQLGKIAEENPDLPFSVIREILIADKEASIEEYQFGCSGYLSPRLAIEQSKNYIPCKNPFLMMLFVPLRISKMSLNPRWESLLA